MEGVGARLGRSSTRYGPATVFTGPVRKWKKRWVPLAPPNNNHHQHNNNNNHRHPLSHINGTSSTSVTINGDSNGNASSSHLLFLYKWTPLAPNNKDTNSTPDNTKDQDPDEAPKRKFKYLPVYLFESEKKEATENEAAESIDDESKPIDADPRVVEANAKNYAFAEKPNINDVPMDENQDDDHVVRQDLNECLDLSLGLKSHDGNSDSKPDHSKDGQLERANGSSVRT